MQTQRGADRERSNCGIILDPVRALHSLCLLADCRQTNGSIAPLRLNFICYQTEDTLNLPRNRAWVESGILRQRKYATGQEPFMIVTVCNIFAQKAYRPLSPGVLGTSDSRPCCFYCGKGLASRDTLNSRKAWEKPHTKALCRRCAR